MLELLLFCHLESCDILSGKRYRLVLLERVNRGVLICTFLIPVILTIVTFEVERVIQIEA